MRILLTGHLGYVGAVLGPRLAHRGHEVVGLDHGLLAEGRIGPAPPAPARELRIDIRDVRREDLVGFDAVVHLAALSNDPLGDLEPAATEAINRDAAVRLARLARDAGVPRFVQASTCSVYGAAPDGLVDESSPPRPVTPYARTKLEAESGIGALADDTFCPVLLRAATAYGFSPRLRGDLVVNNLVLHALATGEVRVKSDGTPWRPLVHVEDLASAFIAAVEAPAEEVRRAILNVGSVEPNRTVAEIAETVARLVRGSRVVYLPGGGPDARTYRARFERIARRLPAYRPRYTLERGVEELVLALAEHRVDDAMLEADAFFRTRRARALIAAGRLDESLRPVRPAPAGGPA